MTICRECAVNAYERVKNSRIDGKSGKLCGRWNARCDKKQDERWCEKKETKIRRSRKYVALDEVILWRAKRIWLNDYDNRKLFEISGALASSMTRFFPPFERWLLVCESRKSFCMRYPILETTSNRLQTNHHRSSAFVVCINFNINSIWFCLPSFFFFFSISLLSKMKRNESKYYASNQQ